MVDYHLMSVVVVVNAATILPSMFSLEIYFQMVHGTIGRYETPSLYTTITVGRV